MGVCHQFRYIGIVMSKWEFVCVQVWSKVCAFVGLCVLTGRGWCICGCVCVLVGWFVGWLTA